MHTTGASAEVLDSSTRVRTRVNPHKGGSLGYVHMSIPGHGVGVDNVPLVRIIAGLEHVQQPHAQHQQ